MLLPWAALLALPTDSPFAEETSYDSKDLIHERRDLQAASRDCSTARIVEDGAKVGRRVRRHPPRLDRRHARVARARQRHHLAGVMRNVKANSDMMVTGGNGQPVVLFRGTPTDMRSAALNGV